MRASQPDGTVTAGPKWEGERPAGGDEGISDRGGENIYQ